MAEYLLVPVFLSDRVQDARGLSYVPGLYALYKPSDKSNVYIDFLERMTSLAERRALWEAKPGLRAHYADFLKFDAALITQLQETGYLLKKRAQTGRLLSPPDWGAFTPIYAGGLMRASMLTSAARKFRSLRRGPLSLVRLYGVQFGRDLVVVTDAAVKTTRRNDEDPRLRTIFAETEHWARQLEKAGVRPHSFQAYNTLPILLEDV